MNFLPVISRIRSRLRRPLPLRKIAAEVRELEPASSLECRPPVSLPGELDRVVDFLGGAENQVPRLLATVREEGPTLSYRFRNAMLADFTVYCGNRYEVYSPSTKRPVLTGSPEKFGEAELCTTNCAQTYFGHFLREALPLEILAQQRGMPALTFRRQPWLHEPGYRSLVELEPVETSYAEVTNLWITDERALNEGWKTRFQTLRRTLRAKFTPARDTHVYLQRGTMGTARNLLNEDEIAGKLEFIGFRVIAPETMSAEEIANVLVGAKVIVCVEGSVQQHAFIAMPEGATLVSIQPPARFNSIAKLLSDAVEARFAYVVAEPAVGGFTLEPDRLLRTIDLI
jgi:hypothetical protein